MAINRKGDRDGLTTPALKKTSEHQRWLDVRQLDLAEVRPAMAPVGARGQHQPVDLHDPPNPLVVVVDAAVRFTIAHTRR